MTISNEPTPLSMIRMSEVPRAYGKKKSAVYTDIQRGLLPKPVPLGARAAAIPAHEIDAVLRARISGAKELELRDLVDRLHAKRQESAPLALRVSK